MVRARPAPRTRTFARGVRTDLWGVAQELRLVNECLISTLADIVVVISEG